MDYSVGLFSLLWYTSTSIPLRNREGILRQTSELDLPYHEVMKGKVEIDDFPPRIV